MLLLVLDDSGDVTVSGTWSGVTVTHTCQDGADQQLVQLQLLVWILA